MEPGKWSKYRASEGKARWFQGNLGCHFMSLQGWRSMSFRSFLVIFFQALVIAVLALSTLLLNRGHSAENLWKDWTMAFGSCISPPIQYYVRTLWDPNRVETCSDLVLQAAARGRLALLTAQEIKLGKRSALPLDGCTIAKGGNEGRFDLSDLEEKDSACKLSWITFSTECGKNLGRIADICHLLGIELIVVGLGEMWVGWGGRMRVVREAILSLPADRIVFSSDADDVLLLPTPACSPSQIIQRFSSIGAPVVITAERYCYPDGERWIEFQKPPNGSPFWYVNAGSYIGYAWGITDFLGEAYHGDCLDDQRELTSAFLRNVSYVGVPNLTGVRQIVDKSYSGSHRNPYARLDSAAKVIVAMGGSEKSEFDLSRYLEEGTVRDTVTNSTPCFLHQNGKKEETPSRYVALPHIIEYLGLDEFLRGKGYARDGQ